MLRLKWANRLMEKRYEQEANRAALVIIIDDLLELIKFNQEEVEIAISQLVGFGREVGIHLVASTLGWRGLANIARLNWPTRIVGKVVTPGEGNAVLGFKNSGVENLTGRGDFLLFAQNELLRLQGAYTGKGEIEQTVLHLGGAVTEEKRVKNIFDWKKKNEQNSGIASNSLEKRALSS